MAVEKIFVGFFKKVVIADRLAIYINHIYSSSSVSSLDILLVFYLFAIQIYCDFSGYCDIAVGISRVFGIDLTENFKQPYYSASIKEFWSRWHITLSFWFRDYLYIPLGGKFGVLKGSLNLFLVFLLSGLWHGANWTFVFWGAIHGVIILIEKHINPFRKLPVICKILLNFHIVSFAWIFFRSSNLDQSFMMIKSFFNFEFSSLNLGGSALDLCFGLACFGLVLVYDYFLFNKRKLFKPLGGIGIGSYWCKVTGASIIMVFGVFSQTEFLYFQF